MPRPRRTPTVTKQQIEGLLDFDPAAGQFRWRNGIKKGEISGRVDTNGYVKIKLSGVRVDYPAHYLAWTVTYGTYPSRRIGHLNGDRADNRPSNLYILNDRRDELTAEILHRSLRYDPDTGKFTWLISVSRHAKAGEVAGHLDVSEGYEVLGISGRKYKAHRLAWFYIYGEWPPHEIDHINGNRSDNRIANLRLATDAENSWNASRRADNTTGYKGVTFHKRIGKFQAYVSKNRKIRHLGYFSTAEDAHRAYVEAVAGLHGEFANTGQNQD